MIKNQVRIIAGKWRGRKISFADIEGLRPTPDRIRETLFNWLSPIIRDKCCLDLFAGSGALGFEALSRGAKKVTFVDSHPEVIKYLKQNQEKLKCENMEIHYSKALNFLEKTNQQFDIIFLDPPFHQDLIAPICKLIDEKKRLAPDAHLYIESELDHLDLPPSWQMTQSKKAGMVYYYLLIYSMH